jgi:hypothetical protein
MMCSLHSWEDLSPRFLKLKIQQKNQGCVLKNKLSHLLILLSIKELSQSFRRKRDFQLNSLKKDFQNDGKPTDFDVQHLPKIG